MMTMAVPYYTHNHNLGTPVSFLRLYRVLILLICLPRSANGFVLTNRRPTKHAGNIGYKSVNTNRRLLSPYNFALSSSKRNDDKADVGQDGEGFFETEDDLQAKLNTITSTDELPLFSFNYNPDAYDETKLAVPPFTAYVIFIFSILITANLYYIGIYGFD